MAEMLWQRIPEMCIYMYYYYYYGFNCLDISGPKEDLSIVTDLLQGQSDLIGEPVDLLCDLYSAGIVNRRMLENLLQNSEEEHLKKLIIAKQRVFLKAHNRYLNYVLQVLEENDNNYLDSVVSDIRKGK